jgi:L-erythro-3,5-diaminohexanoate dehydrogenase
LLSVETLNVDAASFRQMEEAGAEGAAGVAKRVADTVLTRGKQHNPVTGSGGMLLGRVLQVTPQHPHHGKLRVGDHVASLVSLSLTPLRIDEITATRTESAQLDVRGEAVLFAGGAYALIPADMSERLALAALDVAGAAPQVLRLVKPGSSVLVLGAGGKSGLLSCYAARQAGAARVVGIESHAPYAEDLRSAGVCDVVLPVDARESLEVRKLAVAANAGREFDLAISCVNVEATEMAAILPLRDRGTAYFFAMSTSFSRAALGAEGVGKDVDLMIGNGFADNHANVTLDILRGNPQLRALFEARYGGTS